MPLCRAGRTPFFACLWVQREVGGLQSWRAGSTVGLQGRSHALHAFALVPFNAHTPLRRASTCIDPAGSQGCWRWAWCFSTPYCPPLAMPSHGTGAWTLGWPSVWRSCHACPAVPPPTSWRTAQGWVTWAAVGVCCPDPALCGHSCSLPCLVASVGLRLGQESWACRKPSAIPACTVCHTCMTLRQINGPPCPALQGDLPLSVMMTSASTLMAGGCCFLSDVVCVFAGVLPEGVEEWGCVAPACPRSWRVGAPCVGVQARMQSIVGGVLCA